MGILHAYPNGIYCLDSNYIKDELAAVYFIVEGDAVAIIETATSYSVPIIIKALNDLGLSPKQVHYLIPTHIHLDHAGGCGALLQHCPNAHVLVHPRGLRHLIDPSRLIAGAKAVYGEKTFKRLYQTILPIPSNRISVQQDGSSISLNQRKLDFYHTEGHAKHHFCIHDKSSNSIFTGDTFGLSYPALNNLSNINTQHIVIPTTTPVHFDPVALKKSLHRIVSVHADTLYLTHYGPVDYIKSAYCQLLFWVSYYDGLVHHQIRKNTCSEEHLYQSLLQTTQAIYAQSHALKAADINKHLAYDLRLNAQGLYYYSQNL